jgi:biopolymer transport protein ExbD
MSTIRTRGRRRGYRAFELQLTSMMDALVIIVVFLLKNYNVSENSFTSAAGLELPLSVSGQSPNDSVQVILTPTTLTVEKEKVLDFLPGEPGTGYTFRPTDLADGGKRVIPLYDALVKERERTELLLAQSKARQDGKPLEFEGIVAIQADKKVEYQTLKRVLYTAGIAGYKVVRFLAQKRET